MLQDATLAHYAGYTEEDIQPVFKLMVDYLAGPVVHDAFFRKYASKKFMKGMHIHNQPTCDATDTSLASIHLRQWAKKWAPKYLDGVEVDAGGETPVL